RLLAYERHRRPRRGYVGVVHRLDRDTSGALAFALSPAARAGLRALFRAHRMDRRYAALVEGVPRGEEGTIDLPIHDVYEGGRRVTAESPLPADFREALARLRAAPAPAPSPSPRSFGPKRSR